MPTFDTPRPITASVDLPIGELRVTASDRTDTTVEVHSSAGDRGEAEAVRVELVGDELHVQGRKLGLRTLLVPTPGRTLEVEVTLPSGSALTARCGYGSVQVDGRLAGCRVQTAYGDVRLEDTGPVDLTTDYGTVRVAGTVDGDATVVADHGELRLDRITGDADLRTKHGTIRVAEVGGAARLANVHGDTEVEAAEADVEARSAYGRVRLGRVVRGEVTMTSTHGRLEVAVAPQSAVWLDVDTRGRVRNALEPREGPDGFVETVAVRARSQDGDVVVRRSTTIA